MKGSGEKTEYIIAQLQKMEGLIRDIQDTDELFQTFTEAFPILMFWLDPKGKIMDYFTINRSMLYTEPEMFLGKFVSDVLPKETGHKIERAIVECQRSGKVHRVEYTLPLATGEATFEAFLLPFKNENVCALIKDLTEVRRIEKGLRESEEMFRNLAEESPNMIFLNDHGRIIYVNRLCETIMGYTKEEFYSKDFDYASTVAPEYKQKVRDVFAKKLRREAVLAYEYVIITKQGKRLAAVINSKLLQYKDRDVLLGIITVIDELKKTEEELRQKSEFLEGVLRNVSDGIFVLDDGSNYVYINEECGRIIGLRPEDWIGKRAGMAIHPDDADRVLSHFISTVGGERSRFEARIKAADDAYKTLDIKLSPMSWAGKRHILGVVTDITERKRTEKNRREKARDEVYGFLASAIPAFAMNMSGQAKDTLVATFGDRFEANMKGRFLDYFEQFKKDQGIIRDGKANAEVLMLGYLKWLKGYLTNLGVQVEVSNKAKEGHIEMISCPWVSEARGSPVFCQLCRAIILRSFTWTGIKGNATHMSSIADGKNTCKFELQLE